MPTHSLCPQGGTEDRSQSLTNHERVPVMMLLQWMWFDFVPSSLTEKYISSLKFTVVKTTLGIPYYKGGVYSPTKSLGSLFIKQKNGRTLKAITPSTTQLPRQTHVCTAPRPELQPFVLVLKKALKDKKTIVLKTHNKTKQRKTKGNNLIERHWNLYRMVKSKKGGNKTPNEDGFALKSSQKAYKNQKTGKVNVLQELNGNKSNNYWQWIHSTRTKMGPSLPQHRSLTSPAWPNICCGCTRRGG